MNQIVKTDKKVKLMARLKRIEGQVRAVHRMIEEEEDCEHISQQLAASRKALDKVFYEMMACMVEQQMPINEPISNEVLAGVERMTQLLTKYA